MKRVVIVGGQFAGVGTAHRFFKKAAKAGLNDFHLTLISRDSHFYWNLAAPRGLVPGQLSEDELFKSIPEGFQQYGDKFEFVLGSVTALDPESKSLRVVGDDKREIKIDYDTLVLATGARTLKESPFKSAGSTEGLKHALRDYHSRIDKADTIAIVGAGTTGVETAGELAGAYGSKKKIILLASGPAVLPGVPPKMQNSVHRLLRTVGVDLRLNAKVQSSEGSSDGKTQLTLKSGETLLVDFEVPTYGVVPNSKFLPSKYLNQNGYVVVDDHLRMAGLDDVFAIGEVSALEPMQFVNLENQSTQMAANLIQIVSGKDIAKYQPAYLRLQGVSVSKKYAAGHVLDWHLPGFFFRFLRSKLFVDWLPGRVDGSAY